MSRPIEFRAKRVDNGEWIYGAFMEYPSSPVDPLIFATIGDCSTMSRSVRRETVGQFTGLHDKNGKMIFEGDLVLMHDGLDEPLKCSVRWSEEHCRFACSSIDSGAGEWLRSMNLDYEVIGTIHDKGE
jgi:hypothetical protein